MDPNTLRRRGTDIGLLLLRLGVGLMMAFGHGLGKVQKFLDGSAEFGDPIGIGARPSLFLAGGAEFVCSLLVVLGLATRLSAAPVLFTMLVAVFVVHADDPWQKKEFALLYAVPMLALILTGPGRLSVDELIRRWWDARRGGGAGPAAGETGL